MATRPREPREHSELYHSPIRSELAAAPGWGDCSSLSNECLHSSRALDSGLAASQQLDHALHVSRQLGLDEAAASVFSMATLQRLRNPASLQRTGQSGQCQPSVADGVTGTVEFNVRKERANLAGVEAVAYRQRFGECFGGIVIHHLRRCNADALPGEASDDLPPCVIKITCGRERDDN